MDALPWVIAGVALFLGAVTVVMVVVMAWQVRQLQGQRRDLSADLAAALREMEQLAAMTAKLGIHIGRVERGCSGLAERLEIMELRNESRSFDRAIASARRGADPVRLERQFGLSQTEAGLVTLLHGAQRRLQDPRGPVQDVARS
ncbi:MAG: DUF2802 domain-containing protein [Proteobacteria bacterium]|nr:DUF2802 domain-containing protein [Pseudomonadota bacterium]